ncbi:hypothetical protein ES702_04088 [subsurface metagenome]
MKAGEEKEKALAEVRDAGIPDLVGKAGELIESLYRAEETLYLVHTKLRNGQVDLARITVKDYFRRNAYFREWEDYKIWDL